jgi:hypothetical protein
MLMIGLPEDEACMWKDVMGSKSIGGRDEWKCIESVRIIGSLIQCVPTEVPRREFSPISRK